MTDNLWSENTPSLFWLVQPDPTEEAWEEAIRRAFPALGLPHQIDDIETALTLTLGEAQFGPDHWQLSRTRRLYYMAKPFLPRTIINLLKTVNSNYAGDAFPLGWPIERRYAQFQGEVMKQLLMIVDRSSVSFRHFWPAGQRFAFVLTHDIETGEGQALVHDIANLEEELGFRSSFNFVPERYVLDERLMGELRERGFEIGVHGLKHDGKLFSSENTFVQRSQAINSYLGKLSAVGFRSPLMQRNPDWMQVLQIEYDLSFFDTDPYEPIPGGCMTIWPFTIGHFIELPYTLVQDSTLGFVLGETTPRLWLDKLEFIEEYHGMALVNTHPDYLKEPKIWDIYLGFLNTLKEQNNYWHALPRDVARWWRKRSETPPGQESSEITLGTLFIENDRMIIN